MIDIVVNTWRAMLVIRLNTRRVMIYISVNIRREIVDFGEYLASDARPQIEC